MNKDNIKLVINALSRVTEKEFDIRLEFSDDATTNSFKSGHHACDTTACAAGFASLDGKCNAKGLKPKINNNGRLVGFSYKNMSSHNAIADFLGLDEEVSNMLFAYGQAEYLYGKTLNKITPADVIYQLEYLRLTGELHMGNHA